MKANLQACLAEVLRHEGGFVNNIKDPGGATNRGVTQKVYDGWRAVRGLPKRSVAQVTGDEVDAIYRRQYWDAVRADDLPAGIDFAVFDYGVNSGPMRSAKSLQSSLGVQADGHVGMVTLAKAKEIDAVAVINKICDERLAFMKRIKHPRTKALLWKTFGKGWARRVKEVREKAIKMARAGA